MSDKNQVPLVESLFTGGIFGSGATVPWEGEEFKEALKDSGRAIATESDGIETFIEGAVGLSSLSGGSTFNPTTQANRIKAYRRIQYYPEVSECIDNIVNDAISSSVDRLPIELDFKLLEEDEDFNLTKNVKKAMSDAHKKILKLTKISENPTDVFKKFYVDGKMAFQIILPESPKKGDGITRLVPLESSSIFKVKIVKVDKDSTGIEYVTSEREAYLYDAKTFKNTNSKTVTVTGINEGKILEMPFESIAYADSGQYTVDGKGIVGFMEPAVKPANNLATVEDATVIYSITRAVDRRAIFVDVGDLPTKSAEEVVKRTMGKFKSKLNYNVATGAVDNNSVNMSMTQDFYLARKDGKNVADIQTLDGGNNIGQINHIQYFKEKLYTALKIPRARAREESASINIGGSDLAEVSRAEYKFSNHVKGIRRDFSSILKHCLKVELIQNGTMTESEWNEIQDLIIYDFVIDSFIIEQQENETLSTRMELLRTVEPYIGKLFSMKYVKEKVLRMSDDEIQNLEKEIEKEREEGLYDEYGETPLQMETKEERDRRLMGNADGMGTGF